MRRLFACAAVVVLASMGGVAQAGPWVNDWGSGYVKAGWSLFSSDQSFRQGVVVEGASFEAWSLSLYGEVGLPLGLQLIFDVPYVVATNRAISGAGYVNHTFGDGRFGLEWGLPVGLPLAVGLDVKVPLYEGVMSQSDGGIVTYEGIPWPAESFPDVGDGNVDLTPRFMAGWGFDPIPLWVTGEVGYRGRFSGFVDGLYGALGVGGFVWPDHVILSVYSNGVVNLGEDENPTVQATKEWLYLQGALTITAAPWVPNLALTASYGTLVLSENSSPGDDFALGLSYDW